MADILGDWKASEYRDYLENRKRESTVEVKVSDHLINEFVQHRLMSCVYSLFCGLFLRGRLWVLRPGMSFACLSFTLPGMGFVAEQISASICFQLLVIRSYTYTTYCLIRGSGCLPRFVSPYGFIMCVWVRVIPKFCREGRSRIDLLLVRNELPRSNGRNELCLGNKKSFSYCC
jgi:hypothetical protein